MGWCSGTQIFDEICDILLNNRNIKKSDQKKITKKLIETLEDMDWDCQADSAHFEHPIVREIFEEFHPHWYEDDDVVYIEDAVVVMSGFRNPRLHVAIEDAGGRVTNTVSSKTTHLLISGKTEDQGSSKLEKAEELGVIIMTPEEFAREYGLDWIGYG